MQKVSDNDDIIVQPYLTNTHFFLQGNSFLQKNLMIFLFGHENPRNNEEKLIHPIIIFTLILCMQVLYYIARIFLSYKHVSKCTYIKRGLFLLSPSSYIIVVVSDKKVSRSIRNRHK